MGIWHEVIIGNVMEFIHPWRFMALGLPDIVHILWKDKILHQLGTIGNYETL